MRLLVAGWHGLVARALIEAAPGSPHVKALAAGRPALDVRDPRSIERAFGDLSPNMVINSAAYTAVDKAEQDQDACFALNRDGAALLARAAARRNIPVIHLSTHYVFDGEKHAPYDEADTPSPATVYGRSKLEGEQAVAAANPRHVIVRTGWVFSTASNGGGIGRSIETGRRSARKPDLRPAPCDRLAGTGPPPRGRAGRLTALGDVSFGRVGRNLMARPRVGADRQHRGADRDTRTDFVGGLSGRDCAPRQRDAELRELRADVRIQPARVAAGSERLRRRFRPDLGQANHELTLALRTLRIAFMKRPRNTISITKNGIMIQGSSACAPAASR
jgi:hypothetical protein